MTFTDEELSLFLSARATEEDFYPTYEDFCPLCALERSLWQHELNIPHHENLETDRDWSPEKVLAFLSQS